MSALKFTATFDIPNDKYIIYALLNELALAVEQGFQQYAKPTRKRRTTQPVKKAGHDKKRLTIVLEC